NYKDAWQEARARNEEVVFGEPRTRRLMEGDFARVRLYTDFVPDKRLSSTEAQALAGGNYEFQLLVNDGNRTAPQNVIVRPDPNMIRPPSVAGFVVPPLGGIWDPDSA